MKLPCILIQWCELQPTVNYVIKDLATITIIIMGMARIQLWRAVWPIAYNTPVRVFTAILIAGIKRRHVYDRITTRTRTVGTKCNNTPQRRLYVTRTSRICRRAQHTTRAHATSRRAPLTNTAARKGITYRGSTNIRRHCKKNVVVMANWRPGFVHLLAISIPLTRFHVNNVSKQTSNRWNLLYEMRLLRRRA